MNESSIRSWSHSTSSEGAVMMMRMSKSPPDEEDEGAVRLGTHRDSPKKAFPSSTVTPEITVSTTNTSTPPPESYHNYSYSWSVPHSTAQQQTPKQHPQEQQFHGQRQHAQQHPSSNSHRNYSLPPLSSSSPSKSCLVLKNPFRRLHNNKNNSRAPTSESSRASSNASTTTSSPTPPTPPLSKDLLSLPTVNNRQNRLEYEQSRRRACYEGELEPAGVRGQQAPMIRTPTTTAPALPTAATPLQIVRPVSADETNPNNEESDDREDDNDDEYDRKTHSLPANRTTQKSLPSHQRRRLPPSSIPPPPPSRLRPPQSAPPKFQSFQRLKPVDEEAPLPLTPSQRQVNSRSGRNHPSAATTSAKPRTFSRWHSDEESTCSDDEIRDMLPDLLDDNNNNSCKNFPNLLHSPSADDTPNTAASTNRDYTRSLASKSAAQARSNSSSNPGTGKHDNSNKNNNSNEIATLNHQAMEHVQAGQYDVALQLFSLVLQQQLQRHGKTHAATASAYHNLGTVHCKRAAAAAENDDHNNSTTSNVPRQRCRQQALECFQAAARSARDSLGKNHPNVAVSLVRVGFLLLQSRQYQNAVVTFREALRIRVAHYGPQHGLVANLYNNLGVCYMHLAEFEHGRTQLQQALQIQRRAVEYQQKLTFSPKHAAADNKNNNPHSTAWLELADTLFNLGGLCLEWIRRQGPDARRAVEAEHCFREAYQIRSQWLPPDSAPVQQVAQLLDMAQTVPRPRLLLHNSHNNNSNKKQSDGVGSPSRRYVARQPSSPKRGSDADNGQLLLEPPAIPRTSPSRDIFRAVQPKTPVVAAAAAPVPPVPTITFSKDDADDSDDDDQRNTNTRNHPERNVHSTASSTRIYVAPHIIPELSPLRRHRNTQNQNASAEAIVVNSREHNDSHSFQLDESRCTTTATKEPTTYESEETCLIHDSGIDGRIHYPLAWSRAGIGGPADATTTTATTGRRDIMVAQPLRPQNNPSRSSPGGGVMGLVHSMSSDQWGSETVNVKTSTGNKERDELLARAKAMLQLHEDGKENLVDGDRQSDDQDCLEDGIAPLGGNWPSPSDHKEKVSLREMLQDPGRYLPEIHAQAARHLQQQNAVDAHRLFAVVLDVQRHQHGPLHPDVAAALHNVGLAQLRLQNYAPALQALEESARIRKGCLGPDHPHVALSLVKVGITLLLLHRFEEALWSFREALSVRKKALGPLHPSIARIYNNIGCVHVEFNEFKEARRAFEAALDTQRNALLSEPDNGPLMFATATSLCNLGYLYRYRDMHAKAAIVLWEAVELQEAVLGRSHATVLSTLDNLADSCANSGQTADALRHYQTVLVRYRASQQQSRSTSGKHKFHRAEAVLLYKISRVHRQLKNRTAQLQSLQLALKAIRESTMGGSSSSMPEGPTTAASAAVTVDTLERRIRYDIRVCREEVEMEERNRL